MQVVFSIGMGWDGMGARGVWMCGVIPLLVIQQSLIDRGVVARNGASCRCGVLNCLPNYVIKANGMGVGFNEPSRAFEL